MKTDLSTFKLIASDDAVKRDLELTCTECEAHLCDAEDGDTLEVLVSMAEDHTCGDAAKTYKIVRHFQEGYASEVLVRGLTLEQAQAHCNDPETSSRTATSAAAVGRTESMGAWFDGYTEEV